MPWVPSFLVLAVVTPGHAGDDEAPRTSFDFAYDVAPILVQHGCAAARCHGGATGRGGFKLSLFSTDPAADHRAIAVELDARRIDVLRPERSLLLRKPTEDLDHGGGRRLAVDSPAYAALRDWIARGAPHRLGPPEEIAELELHWQDERTALTATAHFTVDATTTRRDVTALTVFESTDERVAAVDARGRVTLQGPGEAWILARYAGRSARALVRRPFADASANRAPSANPLDEPWRRQLTALGLEPAPAADDGTRLRRLTLDLAGRFPTPTERERFHADVPDARWNLALEERLASAEFEEPWAHALYAWFEVPEPDEDRAFERARHTRLRNVLRRALAPDRTLRDLVEDVFGGGPGGELVARFQDPRDRAEYVGRAFLGMSLGCARCHNHPGDRWTQDEHLAFSACFADRRPAGEGTMRAGMLFHPETGEPVTPHLLGLVADPTFDGDPDLAAFVLDAQHDAFARQVVNRVFHRLLGRAFVEPLDDARLANPAIHEELLAALAAHFRASDFDLRALVRAIATLRAYSLTSEAPITPRPGDPERRFLARREAQALDPRAFQRAVCRALDVPLPDAAPPRSPLAFRLHVLNGALLHDPLNAPGNAVAGLFDFVADPEQRLDTLYALLLTRAPRPAERAAFLPLLRADADGSALRDLAFALLASREGGLRR